MPGDMFATLLQQDIIWNNPTANQQVAERAVGQVACTENHLFVLPEMFSTGFATDPRGLAEDSGQSLAWMQRMARTTGAAFAASVATQCDDRYFNRLYFVKPDGTYQFYDKHHLFAYAGEDRHYTAGDRRVVVEWGGVRFLLLVCYDLRFPVWARSREDYDAIICVASWPESRRMVWDTLLRARAIENQCYVLGVNRVGDDPQCHYNGGTVAIDPYGRPMQACPDNTPSAITVPLDLQRLNTFRTKFPVLKDRDLQ